MSYIHDLVSRNKEDLVDLYEEGYTVSSIPDYIKGSIKVCEAQAIYCIIKDRKYKNILDIGTGPGFSCLYMAKALEDSETKGKVTTIDINEEFVLKSKSLINKFNLGEYVNYVCGDSSEVLSKMPDASFDLTIIDGNHKYDQCKKDFENAYRLIAPGGCIVFDDIYYRPENNPGPRNVFEESVHLASESYFFEEETFNLFQYSEDLSEIVRMRNKWDATNERFVLKKSNTKEVMGFLFK
tara:strand:+ start:1108 stop:1824 length:717 start_codon:yes stop_codon:yes gene_type:complete